MRQSSILLNCANSIDWDSKRETEASQSVIASAFRLEDLSCNLPRDSEATYEGLADAILKGPVKTLRKLNFSSIMSKEIQFNPFFGSIEELTRLSGQVQNLESLSFHFHHKAMNAHDTDHCFLVSEKCKVLDRLLDDARAFPSLKEVQISFIVSVRDDSRYGIFVLEDEFKAASLDIKEHSFQNLKGNATIKFIFDLEMEWR
ncbi:hypothetical protein BDN70DRAFT_272340 [Pholiota conissans]|uniref:Uncharacterized protein n=1 Tax=Pholiota conissans TaxID=109636 RepID=A0A9P5YU38_9AGAR|nr:hypothetical protein BDN70DRAFT_272340 [Pholiota conissans]